MRTHLLPPQTLPQPPWGIKAALGSEAHPLHHHTHVHTKDIYTKHTCGVCIQSEAGFFPRTETAWPPCDPWPDRVAPTHSSPWAGAAVFSVLSQPGGMRNTGPSNQERVCLLPRRRAVLAGSWPPHPHHSGKRFQAPPQSCGPAWPTPAFPSSITKTDHLGCLAPTGRCPKQHLIACPKW